ncbi:MAG: trypsin-like peptidase domain-containing protein [Eubacteriales bacterium]
MADFNETNKDTYGNNFDGEAENQTQEVPEAENISSAENTPEKETQPEVNPGENPKKYYYTWNGDKFIRRKKRSGLRALAATVAAALILAFAGFALTLITRDKDFGPASGGNGVSAVSGEDKNISKQGFNNPGNISAHPKPAGTDNSSLADLYEMCSVSCCSIYIPLKSGYVLGSGFVVDAEEGYIVTNNHVVEKNEGKIQVRFYDSTQYDATLVGRDSLTDIAVLKIEAENLSALEIGDSSQARVGDQVIAIGTPYSLNLAGTLTNGIISGIERDMELTDDFGAVVKTMTLLQTNSSINRGNSGGPLINMYGQVIGINTLKLASDYEGLGFAIPMSYAVVVINNLIDYGEVRDNIGFVKATAKLNITVATDSTSDAAVRSQYSLPENVPEGILVIEITRNSAIYKAGLELYDIITEFGGARVKNYADLANELANYSAGQEISVTIYRMARRGGGEYKTLTFKLDSAS